MNFVSWDQLIRQYLTYTQKLKSEGAYDPEFDKTGSYLRGITEFIDNRFVQRSIDKVRRENETQYLTELNNNLRMRLEAKEANKKSMIGFSAAGLGAINKQKKSKMSKMFVLGIGTFALLWAVARYNKLKAEAAKAKDPNTQRQKYIRERIIERIPATRERVIESTKRVVVDEPEEDDKIISDRIIDETPTSDVVAEEHTTDVDDSSVTTEVQKDDK